VATLVGACETAGGALVGDGVCAKAPQAANAINIPAQMFFLIINSLPNFNT
jgi:hypothetical protein